MIQNFWKLTCLLSCQMLVDNSRIYFIKYEAGGRKWLKIYNRNLEHGFADIKGSNEKMLLLHFGKFRM